MIDPKELLLRKRERPFRPFRVIMKSGKVYDIVHELDFLPMRDWIHLPGGGRIFGVPEHSAICKYEDIERIEPLPEAPESEVA